MSEALRSLPAMFFDRARRFAGRTRYRVKREGAWRDVSWEDHERNVLELAAGLLEDGVRPGEKIALLAGTRPEWMEIDFAILATGAVTIPIYPSNLAAECGYILWNSESALCFVENAAQLAKIREVTGEGFDLDGRRQRISLRDVYVIDGEGDGATPLAALRARGKAALEARRAEIEKRVNAIAREDLATIVYTSGTTGPPKGVMQTHGNHLATIEALERVGLGEVGAPDQVDFFFLPLAHSFARANEYFGTFMGSTTAFAQGIDTIAADIRETSPTLVPSVPRIFEKIYARILSQRDAGSAFQRAIFDWAVSVGREKSRCLQEGRAVPFLLRLQAAVADALVFGRIHRLLGGRIRYMISGGAPLAREIQEFFHAAGILILEGYGLTETTPTLTINRPDAFRFGTVGRAIEGVELRIAEDGEILARGPNVAQGYFKRPEATAEAWDAEGWFHTGDIGELSEDGFLRITDRKKDLIKTSGGKYVAPQNVENLLKTQRHVSQAVVIGDNRKYCVALITLDLDEVRSWAREQGVPDDDPATLAGHPKVRELLDGEIQAVNRHLASYEQVKYFRILPEDFTQESGELTPSLKVKRKVVSQKYADWIEEMYSGPTAQSA